MTDKTTARRPMDRPLFYELLWDLIDSSDCPLEDMIAELDEALSCLEKRRSCDFDKYGPSTAAEMNP